MLQVALVVGAVARTPPPSREGIDFAWRVHGALDSWTGKVDTKASIALAIESALFGFAITLSQNEGPFGALDGPTECAYYLGLGMILAAVMFALLVVIPQLNRRKSKRNWQTNMIYFGHLRHWDPDDLASALVKKRDDETQLASQLVAMAKIAWRKHSLLQVSLIIFFLAICELIAVAALAP